MATSLPHVDSRLSGGQQFCGPTRAEVGAPGSDTDLQCRPTGWAESWAQNCGGGEMILAAAWLLKP
mgnify:FL=1